MQRSSFLFEKTESHAVLPTKAYANDAGYDIACFFDDIHDKIVLQPFQRHSFRTGLRCNLPDGCYGQLASRSGLALRNGIQVLGGVIDQTYTGEIHVILINLGSEPFVVTYGMRICQLIVIQIYQHIDEKKEEKTKRESYGFGSSGLY